jgi:hypothetical protein
MGDANPKFAMMANFKSFKSLVIGGRKRNRTAVHGFAVRCIATLPSGPVRRVDGRRDIGGPAAQGQAAVESRASKRAAIIPVCDGDAVAGTQFQPIY